MFFAKTSCGRSGVRVWPYIYIYNVREEYWGRLICVFVSVWLETWEKIQVGGHMVKLGFE